MPNKPRLVIITGGTGGLGRSLAQEHLRLGDEVILTGRNTRNLEQVSESLGYKNQLHLYTLDVTDNIAVRTFSAWVKINHERCDILYNNAGTAVFKPFLESDLAEIEQMLAVNINGLLYMTRAFLPMMLANRHGHIVNIASLAGRVASSKAAVYAATKAAVIRFSEGLRHEVADQGITVTAIMPGPIDTPLLDRADQSGEYRGKVSNYLLSPERAASIIMKAVSAKRQEVALPYRLHLLSTLYQLLPEKIQRLLSPLINRK